ncbi:MAG: ribonucleoside-diphosphate reductase subunit alpha [Puniceicoccales bacterium]|jgi:ribonucleoside-diphosphate reductase alpha chain|nr:ribonucleoside-diphosphate reductase subunit alpha [Puniceicoccales bacterium]
MSSVTVPENTPSWTPNARPPRFVRRDGEEVAWNAKRIEKAVGEAFVAQRRESFPTAREIAQTITRRVSALNVPSVALERVQDMVQEELMRRGHFKVAEAYILYRSEHAKLRRPKPKPTSSIQESFLLVKEADGQSRLWTIAELLPRIAFAARGLDLPLSPTEIAHRLGQKLEGEIEQADLEVHLNRQARALVAVAPEFDFFAARFRWSFLYSRLLAWEPTAPELLEKAYREAFPRHVRRAVERGILHTRMLDWDLDRLAEALDVGADEHWEGPATQDLLEHFLLRDWESGEVDELPQFLWMRVAMGIFLSEKSSPREDPVIELYQLLKDRRCCVSPPVLSYAGTPKAQLLSAYVYQLRDDLESIMAQGIADNALAVKWGASLSGSWTAVRGAGSPIRGTRRRSAGVIPFLELHQHQLALARPAIGESPKLYGQAALELWHADIEDFIDFRSSGARASDSSLATELWIPDLFLKRVRAEGEWTLFRVEEVRPLQTLYGEAFERAYEAQEQEARAGRCWGRSLPAAGLWGKILARIYENGFPRIGFKDRCNGAHMLAPEGLLHSSGLESELLLRSEPEASLGCPSAVLSLPRHLDASGALDRAQLRRSVRLAVRALDVMLDAKSTPSPAAEALTLRYRPIALGLVGLQEALWQKQLPFDSPASLAFQDECLEIFSHDVIEASVDLAQERGRYPRFGHSFWAQGKFPWECQGRALRPGETAPGEATPGETAPVGIAAEEATPEGVAKEDENRETRQPSLDREALRTDGMAPEGGNREARKPSLDWEALRQRLRSHGLRHAYLLALPAAESAARLMGCSPGMLPATGPLDPPSFSENRNEPELFPKHALVRTLRSAGVWTAEFYQKLCRGQSLALLSADWPEAIRAVARTAFELDAESLLQAAALRQRWLDQSQTLELYLDRPNMAALSSLYQRAWEYGLKTLHGLKLAPMADALETLPLGSLDAAMAGLRQGMAPYDF